MHALELDPAAPTVINHVADINRKLDQIDPNAQFEGVNGLFPRRLR
jgi:hypothetical protein